MSYITSLTNAQLQELRDNALGAITAIALS